MKKSEEIFESYSFERILECLSEERLRTYFMFLPNEHQEKAVIPYDWMQRLSSMLFIPLQYLEISLRNRVYNVLTDYYIRKSKKTSLGGAPEEWLQWMPSNPVICKDVAMARKNADGDARHGFFTEGSVISRLQFAVWIRILEEHPAKKAPYYFWDSTVNRIFPNAENLSRSEIIRELRDINTLRNRLFHYEPIWKYENMPNYQQGVAEVTRKYEKVMDVIRWISLDVYAFIKSSNHEKRLTSLAIEIHNFLSATEAYCRQKEQESIDEWYKSAYGQQDERDS